MTMAFRFNLEPAKAISEKDADFIHSLALKSQELYQLVDEFENPEGDEFLQQALIKIQEFYSWAEKGVTA